MSNYTTIDLYLSGKIGMFDELLAYQKTPEFKAEEQAQRERELAEMRPILAKGSRVYRSAHPDLVRMRAQAQKHKPALYKQQRGICYHCGIKLGKTYEIDHIKSLINGGTNDLSNLCVCHRRCNRKKGSK